MRPVRSPHDAPGRGIDQGWEAQAMLATIALLAIAVIAIERQLESL